MRGHEETLVALPSHVSTATSLRSAVLLASLQALRVRGLFERYSSFLASSERESLAALGGQWIPVSLAVTHYAACDALALPSDEIAGIGSEIGNLAQRSTLHAVGRLAREAGMTPWAPLAIVDRLRAHSWDGGAITVIKLGPKDARLEWHGQPCAVSTYFRMGFAGVLTALGRLFSQSPVVAPLDARTTGTVAAYRLSWV
jgi:hypothetical protein